MIIESRGFAQYVEVIGTGIPLLCLPAFPFSHIMYREQRELADSAQLILPDYRGTGRSSYTEGPYTMELLADDMLAILDALHIERAVVFGASMGIYVAFALYAAHPERFRGFVIADSRAEADTPDTAARREKTVQALRNEGTSFLRERVSDLFAATTRRENPALLEAMQQAALEEHASGLAEITRGMALRVDRRALLPRISTPTIVICGEEDTVSPPEGMRVMAAAIPNAAFHLIPKAGHLSPLEQPALINGILREFMSSL